uniref:Class IIb bacteriocin, lactobin A/cerein 7B family n=1 Tax=Nostoc sp. PCC 9201 TaxID=2099382 RepID=A0A2P0ZGN5_9NOSO|nr:hypothetical protein [Nostoc sp. PCC 9201]
MASIAISDIFPLGHDLLFDAESYMTDLNEKELDRVVGGTDVIAGIGIGLAIYALWVR